VGARRTIRKRRRETGIALLIAIFILLLIGVVAIALIVSSGTETALAGNYRSSTSVYYAAVAGLEEARARLRSNNPHSFKNTAPTGFLPPSGTPLAVCSPIYVINPVGGETLAPWDPANAYYDSEFNNEFVGVPNCTLPSPSPSTLSVWNRSPLNGLPFPGPFYKWVRINAVTEQSLNLDTSTYDGTIDPKLVYYDGTKLNDKSSGKQVLEITALAVLPNGSQKLLQYIVAPSTLNLNFAGAGSPSPSFPAALTLIGNNVSFTGPNSTQFQVNGNDQCSASSAVYGIGYTNGIVSNPNQGSYSGAGNQSPNIVNLNPSVVPPNLQTPSGLDALVQTITQNADAVLAGPTDETHLPDGMSAGNPVTVVVNGDFDLGSHSTGFGALVVTGIFSYDTDSSWKGIILVIGQGTVVSNNIGNDKGEIDGAILVAKTRDSSGNLLPDPNLGSASFKTNDLSNGGLGIYYSSCWVQAAMPAMPYKILSFHEIAQ
jgi:hypothetical protein